MEYVIIGIVVIAITVIVIFFLKSKKSTSAVVTEEVEKSEENAEIQLTQPDDIQEIAIQLEMLPADAIIDEKKLVEITDSKALAYINNLIPGLVQVANSTNNVAQAVQANGEVLYRAIIPVGAKLADSKAMKDAVRGFYLGSDGIRGHANFVAVEGQKGQAVVANTAAAAIGVASIVVGQYYMSKINDGIGKINDNISKISNFQNNEYRSKVSSLATNVKRIVDFQVEILENNELRKTKISQLDNLETECMQLLEHANLTLTEYTKHTNLDYVDYEREIIEAHNWYMYQKSLLEILYKISELRYILHMGAVSREYCIDILPKYIKQVSETQDLLTQWHQSTAERLDIDISAERRRRDGLDRVVHLLPGFFNDNINFKAIKKNTARMIKTQSANRVQAYDTSDLYAEDVQLISKGGKVYYLPTEKSGENISL